MYQKIRMYTKDTGVFLAVNVKEICGIIHYQCKYFKDLSIQDTEEIRQNFFVRYLSKGLRYNSERDPDINAFIYYLVHMEILTYRHQRGLIVDRGPQESKWDTVKELDVCMELGKLEGVISGIEPWRKKKSDGRYGTRKWNPYQEVFGYLREGYTVGR
jgi:hypothetical protein